MDLSNEKGNLGMDGRKMQNQSEKQRPSKRISALDMSLD